MDVVVIGVSGEYAGPEFEMAGVEGVAGGQLETALQGVDGAVVDAEVGAGGAGFPVGVIPGDAVGEGGLGAMAFV